MRVQIGRAGGLVFFWDKELSLNATKNSPDYLVKIAKDDRASSLPFQGEMSAGQRGFLTQELKASKPTGNARRARELHHPQ